MGAETGSLSSGRRPLPREDTPLLGKPRPSLSSEPKTFANVFFIAIVGAGVLGLPYSFMRTGWLSTLLMIFGVAALTYRCMMLLVHDRAKLESLADYAKIGSFGDLGFAVCGSLGRSTVDPLIVLSHAGFCIGYLIFIGNTLAHLYNSTTPDSLKLAPALWGIKAKSFYIWSCIPFQVGLNSIPTLTLLAPLSIFAEVVDLGAMGVVLVEDVMVIAKQRPSVEPFGGPSAFFYALGVAVYSFEGVGLAVPLEAEMKERSKFGKVLGIAMLFIASMYASLGALGCFAFGGNTKDIVTANMDRGVMSQLVQLGLCINLFFTLPLMMNPVYEVFERRL